MEINEANLPGIIIVLLREAGFLDLHFHTKRSICVQGAFLMVEKRMGTDKHFPSGRRQQSPPPHTSAIKKKKNKQPTNSVCKSFLYKTRQMPAFLKVLQISTINISHNWRSLNRFHLLVAQNILMFNSSIQNKTFTKFTLLPAPLLALCVCDINNSDGLDSQRQIV